MSPILMSAANSGISPDRGVVFTSTVVIAGILIVISMLLLLIFIFDMFGALVPVLERKSNKKKEKDAKSSVADNQSTASVQPVPSVCETNAPVVEQGISGEVVAAISAAIAATEGPSAIVRSIKKKNVSGRNPWSAAATADNTRPF